MVDQCKVISPFSKLDHSQRSSPSYISTKPRAKFEPTQNQSLEFVRRSCVGVITITSALYRLKYRCKTKRRCLKLILKQIWNRHKCQCEWKKLVFGSWKKICMWNSTFLVTYEGEPLNTKVSTSSNQMVWFFKWLFFRLLVCENVVFWFISENFSDLDQFLTQSVK